MFTQDELGIMDAPTADNEVVLASMGGKPRVRGEKGETEAESEGNGVKWEGGKEERGEGGEREVGSGGLRGRKGAWGGDEEDV